ncbi:cytochrome P450 [Artemisia annua]|uniref:Cytochrome P450 n=1 Tax=Artemisia annua TaxID=35608 RepID=A0A2U1PMA0_ARTAN|nr:cytochrome P450 [Artemisia annua]
MATELMSNNYANVALAPHGPYWREIRKIVVLELVSHRRLQMLAHIRVSEVNSSIYGLYNDWISNKGSSETVKVDMKECSNKRSGDTVPEAAGSWPIIGHLHLLAGSQVPHKVLGSMADKLGPIFTFKLGAHRVLVVNNVELAKECLTTNDRVFASRPKSMATELMSNNYANVALAPHGPYWREIRKIVVLELVSHRRLQMLAHIRVSEVNSSIYGLYNAWINNKGSSETVKVDMKEWLNNLILNIVMRMIFGNQFSVSKQINKHQFKEAIRRYSELLAAFVPSDAIPGLRLLDLDGYEKKMKKTAKDMDIVIDLLLEEHKKKMDSKSQVVDSNDQVFITALLFRAKEQLKEGFHGFSTNEIVKATCLAIFAAATDTTTFILASILHGFELQNMSNDHTDMTESPGLTNHKATPLEFLVAPRLLPHLYRESA